MPRTRKTRRRSSSTSLRIDHTLAGIAVQAADVPALLFEAAVFEDFAVTEGVATYLMDRTLRTWPTYRHSGQMAPSGCMTERTS